MSLPLFPGYLWGEGSLLFSGTSKKDDDDIGRGLRFVLSSYLNLSSFGACFGKAIMTFFGIAGRVFQGERYWLSRRHLRVVWRMNYDISRQVFGSSF